MTPQQQIADDLGKRAAQEMEDVLNRHMRVAEDVLEPADLVMMLLNIANGVALGAAYYAMQVSKDETSPNDLLDMTAAALPKLFAIGRPIVLARFAAVGRPRADG
jgi:hypothetical protein